MKIQVWTTREGEEEEEEMCDMKQRKKRRSFDKRVEDKVGEEEEAE